MRLIRRWITPVVGLVLCVWLLSGVVVGAVFSDDSSRCSACHVMELRALAVGTGMHAGVECAGCHIDSGIAGVVKTGFGVEGMLYANLLHRSPKSAAVSDSACRSCHAQSLKSVGASHGIRMRHADITDQRCRSCHGGVGHTMPELVYETSDMDSCSPCHAGSGGDPSSCTLCHIEESAGRERVIPTAWGATHGPNWLKTHGSGDLDGCIQCHAPSKCISCHGVALPHPNSWLRTHGAKTLEVGFDSCHTCHDESWCTRCHGGVTMPHPSGFLPVHGTEAERLGTSACTRCHASQSCDSCHYESAHPHIPKSSDTTGSTS